jgi:uncharacterized protein (TIGR00299 family) protein
MGRWLYVDAIGGAAGDMLLAALLDAGAPEPAVRAAIDAVLPGRFRVGVDPVTRGGFRAALLRVEPDAEASTARTVVELIQEVERAPLTPAVKATARSILERLGQAEARVHGAGPTAPELHELGDDDTLVDVVGFASAADALGVERILVSTLPLGAGSPMPASGGHPEMPLPAPAVLELLSGFGIGPGGSEETVTPTAAAILATLGEPSEGVPSMRLEATGYGAGRRDPPDRPNVVRILLGTPADTERSETSGLRHRRLVLLETNLDDLAPELVADAVDALFAAGALDAWTAPILMKKGRPAILLSALGEPVHEARIRRAFFESTSTFGVRRRSVQRAELERRSVAVPVDDGSVRVKVGLWEGRVVTATPEHDDVAELARRSGRSVRETYEEAMAAARQLMLERAND